LRIGSSLRLVRGTWTQSSAPLRLLNRRGRGVWLPNRSRAKFGSPLAEVKSMIGNEMLASYRQPRCRRLSSISEMKYNASISVSTHMPRPRIIFLSGPYGDIFGHECDVAGHVIGRHRKNRIV
jgi:hypothetical protein